jgi:flagellar biosynthesis protein FliQ
MFEWNLKCITPWDECLSGLQDILFVCESDYSSCLFVPRKVIVFNVMHMKYCFFIPTCILVTLQVDLTTRTTTKEKRNELSLFIPGIEFCFVTLSEIVKWLTQQLKGYFLEEDEQQSITWDKWKHAICFPCIFYDLSLSLPHSRCLSHEDHIKGNFVVQTAFEWETLRRGE